MAYPASAVVFTVRNAGDVIQAAHVNDLQTEVTAIESAMLSGGLAHNLVPATDNARSLGSSAARWIFSGSQITPGSIPSTTLSTTGTPSTSTYLSGGGWAAVSTPSVAVYAATLADCANTTDETEVFLFTVPANAWGAGQVIEIVMASLEKQNVGAGNKTAAWKVNAGAGGQVTLAAAMVYGDSATEHKTTRRLYLQRVGSDVAVHQIINSLTFAALPSAAAELGRSTPTNFTSDFVVSIKLTLDTAHALYYVKPQTAQVIHYKV